MKKKEKEHLKADPFIHFFEQSIHYFLNNRRRILAGAGFAALAIFMLLAVFFFKNLSSTAENKVYSEAFRIRNDAKMSADQKITKLQEMKFKKGISAAGRLFIAVLYYEKGDLQKAEAALKEFPASRIAMLNDEKQILTATILTAGGKTQEAESLLKRMLADKKTAMAKELILIQLAKMQIRNQRQEEAAAGLKRILSEYPNTPSAMEAQNLLATIEGESQAAQ
ncbi:MAG TPA: tetratricopeptide repeat protein [Patescibacteria group bacterium]|nr:tetratricopeptide repeat protein [Patescibacteria group bacterium]